MNIIIETNKAISWVKSSINDGLNKQSNLLGKINPKCTLLPSPNWVVLNPVFFRVCRVCSLLCCAKLKQTAERCILFFFLFYKKAKIIFLLFMYTNKSRPFTIPIIFMTKRSCFHCWKGNKSSLSSFKHSTFTMQPVHYHYKINRSNIWKKHTAQFKYVVKSVLFSVITVPPWSYATHFVLCGYCKGK